ncbi:MAG: hypothetical protein DGJ47_001081 [Rickettsiaceae bacterium]
MFKVKTYNFKNIILFSLGCLRNFKLNISFMILMACIFAIDFSFRKYLIKAIIDTASINQGQSGLISELLKPLGVYIFMALLITTMFRVYGYLIDIKMYPTLRKQIFENSYAKLLTYDQSYYNNHFIGDLVHKLNNISESIIELLKIVISRFFTGILIILISLYTLFLINISFAISTLIWITIFVLTSIKFFPLLVQLSNNDAQSSSKITANTSDSLLNIKSIRLFANESYEKFKFIQLCNQKIKSETKLQKAYFWLWFIYGYSFDLLQILSIYFLIYGFQSNNITLGDFALVIGLNVAIVDFLNQLTYDFTKFSEYYGKLSNSLATIFQYDNLQSVRPMRINSANIEFCNVSFAYHDQDNLFNNLSISIKNGEKIGIVGYSGAGKSSFVNLILKLYEPQSGVIKIDNKKLSKINSSTLHQQIAVIPQEIMLFHRSIFDNIHYGRLEATKKEVIKAAEFAGVDKFVYNLPSGYHTIVGNNGFKLSGGERQRINIARAFLKNSKILILDEATNHLDAVTEQMIQDSLIHLMQNKTSIVISHRLSTLTQMDKILVFEKGKIIERGCHSQLIAQNGRYQELWMAQNNILR